MSFQEPRYIETSQLLQINIGAPKEILQLREMLNAIGYETALSNNTFDAELHNAVEKFQKDKTLLVDGIAGPQTLRQLNREIEQSFDLAVTALNGGESISMVLPDSMSAEKKQATLERAIQRGSAKNLTNGITDMVQGKSNLQVKLDLENMTPQEKYSISPELAQYSRSENTGTRDIIARDGVSVNKYAEIVNREHETMGPIPSFQFIKRGMAGGAVVDVQERLYFVMGDDIHTAAEGTFKVDGDFGPMTQRAVEAFQEQFNSTNNEKLLEVTGVMDPPSIEALNQSVLGKKLEHGMKALVDCEVTLDNANPASSDHEHATGVASCVEHQRRELFSGY